MLKHGQGDEARLFAERLNLMAADNAAPAEPEALATPAPAAPLLEPGADMVTYRRLDRLLRLQTGLLWVQLLFLLLPVLVVVGFVGWLILN